MNDANKSGADQSRLTCDKCGCEEFLASVRERVSGTATQYQPHSVIWCKCCRKKNHGKYMLVEKV